MGDAGGRNCEGCGRGVPLADFSCPGCGKFYAGSFEAPERPASTAPVRAVPDPAFHPAAVGGRPGVPFAKKPMSGLGILAIAAAAAFAVMGVGCAAIVGITVLGSNAKTTYTPVGGQIGGDPDPVATTVAPGPFENSVPDPIGAAELACSRMDDDRIESDWRFGTVAAGGEDQYAQVMQRDGDAQAEWLASVDLATGAIAADTDEAWDDEMGRRTTVVVCASEPENSGQAIECPYEAQQADGTARRFNHLWSMSVLTIKVYTLERGILLGRGEVFSGPPVCPEQPAETPYNRMAPPSGLVERWATEHISGGGVI